MSSLKRGIGRAVAIRVGMTKFDEHDEAQLDELGRVTLAAIEAAGLAVVPIKPTRAMLDEALSAQPHLTGYWQAMIKAAPKP
jgi:hypothetical protein